MPSSAARLCSGARSASASSSRLDAGVDARRAGEARAAVDDAVADRVGTAARRRRSRSQRGRACRPAPASGSQRCSRARDDRRRRASSSAASGSLEPALTMRTRDGAATPVGGPGPVADLGHVLEVLADVGVVAGEHRLAVVAPARRAPGRDPCARGAAPRAPGGSGSSRLRTTMSNGVVVVPCSLKPRTWKRPGCRAAVEQLVQGAGVAVEGARRPRRRRRRAPRSDPRVSPCGWTSRGQERHQVDDVDDPDAQLRDVLAQQRRRPRASPASGCRRRSASTTSGVLGAAVVARPLPARGAGGAVLARRRRCRGTAAAAACR